MDDGRLISTIIFSMIKAFKELCDCLRSYPYEDGKVKITSYKNCKSVSCWFRTTISDGTAHYWLPNMVTISDKSYHKINYCDKNSGYYAKGVKAELRAENAAQELDFKTEKVSGRVYFN